MRIFKYPIIVADRQIVRMPEFAEVLCVYSQNGYIFIWVKVIETMPLRNRVISVYGTGHELSEETKAKGKYVGTVMTHNDLLVWHVFDNGFEDGR